MGWIGDFLETGVGDLYNRLLCPTCVLLTIAVNTLMVRNIIYSKITNELIVLLIKKTKMVTKVDFRYT